MDIRIDESGVFIPKGPGSHRISAVGALILPSRELDELYSEYSDLRASFPLSPAGEVKGSRLDEPDVAATIALLEAHDALFEAVVSDVASHRPRDIVGYQQQRADGLRHSVATGYPREKMEEVHQMAASLRALPMQLFVQHELTIALLDRVLRYAPLYLVQQRPEELGSFTWVVDAKGEQLTTLEDLWSRLILPSQQARTAAEPHPVVPGADYSYFERFLIDEADDDPTLRRQFDEAGLKSVDGAKLLKELSFVDSKTELGLELVDVTASALARALNGHLGRRGWSGLGRLMMRKPRQTLRMVSFKAQKAERGRTRPVPERYSGVVRALERVSKTLAT